MQVFGMVTADDLFIGLILAVESAVTKVGLVRELPDPGLRGAMCSSPT